MLATRRLQATGQSLWLDDITRRLLVDGTLLDYITRLSITGLTSNPALFERAIRESSLYDASIHRLAGQGISAETLFQELELEDLTQAADLLRPVHDASRGLDGWVSLEISPLLCPDAAGSVASAAQLHARARRPNLFIKLPGNAVGMTAIEECIFRGIPVNVTLLFSRAQYLHAADAYMHGIERRLAAGLSAQVASVASIFVSRWDAATREELPPPLRNRLGIAVAGQIHAAYRRVLASARWRRLQAAGARTQRLLWASTGTKDPAASDTLYVEALVAPDTINTVPEPTLLAFAAHGMVGALMPPDGGDSEDTLAAIAGEGVDIDALATRLQREGIQAFSRSWRDMLVCIAGRTLAPGRPGSPARP